MPPKSRIVSSCRLSLLAAAATVLFAGQAEAGNKPTQPLTPAACIAAGIKPPAGFFSWGTGFVPPPKVEFDFLIGAGKPELCPLINVKVTWLYHIADKKTQADRQDSEWQRHFPTDPPTAVAAPHPRLHTNGEHLLQGRKRDDTAGLKLRHHHGQGQRIGRTAQTLSDRHGQLFV